MLGAILGILVSVFSALKFLAPHLLPQMLDILAKYAKERSARRQADAEKDHIRKQRELDKELEIEQLRKQKNDDTIAQLRRQQEISLEDQRLIKQEYMLLRQEMYQARKDIRENTEGQQEIKIALAHTDKVVAGLTEEIIADRPLLEEIAGVFRTIRKNQRAQEDKAEPEGTAEASGSPELASSQGAPAETNPLATQTAGVPLPRGAEPVAPYKKIYKGDTVTFKHIPPPKRSDGNEGK